MSHIVIGLVIVVEKLAKSIHDDERLMTWTETGVYSKSQSIYITLKLIKEKETKVPEVKLTSKNFRIVVHHKWKLSLVNNPNFKNIKSRKINFSSKLWILGNSKHFLLINEKNMLLVYKLKTYALLKRKAAIARVQMRLNHGIWKHIENIRIGYFENFKKQKSIQFIWNWTKDQNFVMGLIYKSFLLVYKNVYIPNCVFYAITFHW